MNMMFLTVLSMSVSGALFILGLLFISWLLRTKCSRRWQYYIWLLVIARLLLPFGPEISLMGRVSEVVNRAAAADGAVSEQRVWQNSYADFSEIGEAGVADSVQKTNNLAQVEKNSDLFFARLLAWRVIIFEKNCFGLIWFTIALGMLARKIVKYQSFIRHVKIEAEPVSDPVLLNRHFEAQWRTGISKKMELFVNPMVSSPMLIGFWRPCIVLPGTDMSEKDFRYVVTHELMHEKRRDILYKWLVQFAVCLHWFNPLVYVMSREISKACELSCDEAVLEKLGYEHAADYGKTLLDAMAAVGKYKEPFAGISLSANKRILKERLGAIMNDKEKSGKMRILMVGLTACMAWGVFFVGIYPADRAEASGSSVAGVSKESTEETDFAKKEQADANAIADAERFYDAGNLPLFEMAFDKLDEKAQEKWLDRIYRDGKIAFFSISMERFNADSPLMQSYAEKAYEDDNISVFSILAGGMKEELLEGWLDQALADEKWNFQSVIYDELGWKEKQDDLEKALEEEQLEEYRAIGITKKGKNYYYKEQLIYIFLDIHRSDQSVYTLNMNPAGTVNVKILRGEDGKIVGAAYMTEAEVTELLGDMYGEDLDKEKTDEEVMKDFPRTMVVKDRVCKIREGAGVEYSVVGLVAEGEKLTVLGSEEGSNGQLWYRLDRESFGEKLDDSVKTCYIRADLLWEELDER